MLLVIVFLKLAHVIEKDLSPLLGSSSMIHLQIRVEHILLLEPVSLMLLDVFLLMQVNMILPLHCLFLEPLLKPPLLFIFLHLEYVISEPFLFLPFQVSLLLLYPSLIACRCMNVHLSQFSDLCLLAFLYRYLLLVFLSLKVKHLSVECLILTSRVCLLVCLELKLGIKLLPVEMLSHFDLGLIICCHLNGYLILPLDDSSPFIVDLYNAMNETSHSYSLCS